ncbi:hypothetical protein E2C01_002411 [Portunus trituberculatus]|uniref:Uncharacterized protein n=1 Tax=Portunus trituberculatus TaxID=210409 RepID=A0A5B7CQN6_PORTR|nr:hypothetical protein [Portunus trituberculatus]
MRELIEQASFLPLLPVSLSSEIQFKQKPFGVQFIRHNYLAPVTATLAGGAAQGREWRGEFSPPLALGKEVLSQEHIALDFVHWLAFTSFL